MNFNSPIDKVSVINPDFSIVLTTSLMYFGYKRHQYINITINITTINITINITTINNAINITINITINVNVTINP